MRWEWLAILIDIVNNNKPAADVRLLLTSSFLDASLVSLESEFFIMESTDINEWHAFRARGPIGFLYSCDLGTFSFCRYFTRFTVSTNCALCEMFCRVGFEQSSPVLIYEKLYFNNCGRMFIISTTVFYALAIILNHSRTVVMLDASIKIGLTRLLHMGLLFPERNNLTRILNDLHQSRKIAALSFRMCRQLFALGLFRQPDYSAKVDPHLSWACRCLYDGDRSRYSWCAICRKGHLINSKECPVLAPLVREFLSGPLTLLQLARIEIRRLIGGRHFERRVDTLKQQLPPLVFRYISRADEMLAENSNEVELSNEFHDL